MKKIWLFLVCTAMVGFPVLGCGNDDDDATDTDSDTDSDTETDTDTETASETEPVETTEYANDDGGADRAFGLAGPGILWWGQYFEADETAEITAVKIAFGAPRYSSGAAAKGDPFYAYLYEDPNDDGVPDDLELLRTQGALAESVGEDVFQTVEFNIPAEVTGGFFVAVSYSGNAGFYPAGYDLHNKSSDSWSVSHNPTTFDPANIYAGISSSKQEPSTIVGTWLLRAIGIE